MSSNPEQNNINNQNHRENSEERNHHQQQQEIRGDDTVRPLLPNIIPNPNIELSDDDDDENDNRDPNENIQNDVAEGEIIYDESEDGDEHDLYWHDLENEDDGEAQPNSDEIPDDDDEEDGGSPAAIFDPELPLRHSYLGEGMESLQGRVLLEEDTILEVPIIVMGLHLVPGQTLPMTVYHTGFQNAIRRSVVNDRLVGLVSNGIGHLDGRTIVNRGALGTLAEIYEFQEEDESEENVLRLLQGSGGFHFAFKAKGRQRFNVLEVRRQADGNLMGKISIRPETNLPPLLMEVISHGAARYIIPNLPNPFSRFYLQMNKTDSSEEEKQEKPEKNAQENSISFSTLMDSNAKGFNDLVRRNQSRKHAARHFSVFMPFPSFVYNMYDEDILVERVHRKLKHDLKGLTESHTTIPLDATELSFWLAQNFIMDDSIRLKILKMDSAVQRLRFELNLLDNVSKVISCRRCQLTIADHSDIFAMSKEGPQGTYVNPQGFVHETLTVHKARDVVYRGVPSTEASWFPGYSWTIVECRGCRSHLGWKFRTTGRMVPKKFWGLARKSVTFKYDFNPESNDPDLLERRQSRTSTIGNGYQDIGPLTLTLPPLLPPYHHGV